MPWDSPTTDGCGQANCCWHRTATSSRFDAPKPSRITFRRFDGVRSLCSGNGREPVMPAAAWAMPGSALQGAFARLRELLNGIAPIPGQKPIQLHLGESRLELPIAHFQALTVAADWTRYPPLGGTTE